MTWPFSTGIWISLALIVVGIVCVIWGLCKGTSNKRPLSKDESQYMARINKELQNINGYYRELAENINIKNLSTRKIEQIDTKLAKLLGFKTVVFSKPPKSSEIYKLVFFMFYNLFKMPYILIKARFNSSFAFKLYSDLGSIPDTVGIGLSSHSKESQQLTNQLLRVVGERVASNQTVTLILLCKDVCYSTNSIYLWLRMYPKAHKKSRLDVGRFLTQLYKDRERMMAYAFADVNKAIIKEFLGD